MCASFSFDAFCQLFKWSHRKHFTATDILQCDTGDGTTATCRHTLILCHMFVVVFEIVELMFRWVPMDVALSHMYPRSKSHTMMGHLIFLYGQYVFSLCVTYEFIMFRFYFRIHPSNRAQCENVKSVSENNNKHKSVSTRIDSRLKAKPRKHIHQIDLLCLSLHFSCEHSKNAVLKARDRINKWDDTTIRFCT